MAKSGYSIIIPTYTGQNTLSGTLDSLIKQESIIDKELIIVIDGPCDRIRTIIDAYTKQLEQKNFHLIVKQFKKNLGRFEARLAGAKIASFDTLIFVDDRVTFNKLFLSDIINIQEDVVIPSVVEAADNHNFMSLAMKALRKVIYTNSSNKDDGFHITELNFDKSAKGTTTILVSKPLFIKACAKLEAQIRTHGKDTNKNVSDDTKLLKIIINSGTNIYKSNKLIINYHPRAGLIEEIKHTYNRGPKFIDYYFKPGTRYFVPLLLSIVLGCLWLVAIVLFGLEFLYIFLIAVLVIILLSSMYLAEFKLKKILPIYLGLSLLITFFSLGLTKGFFIKFGVLFTNK
jgi:glycosyltransferase involved in cell wall biosynthesis